MNIKNLLRVWICPLVLVILVNSSDAWFFSKVVKAVNHVANYVASKIKKPSPSTGAQSSGAPSTIPPSPNCPTSHKFIPVQDALDAAWAARVVYWTSSQSSNFYMDKDYKIKHTVVATDVNLKAFVLEKVVSGKTTRIISFRGTKTGLQLMIQFVQGMWDVKHDDNQYVIGGKNVRVLSFIMMAYQNLIDGLKAYIADPNVKYIITGHSMGGSVASLFAIKAKFEFPDVWAHGESSLITFGAPRLGNTDFAKLHDEYICPDRKIRLVYHRDPAPRVPFTTGKNDDFTHHSREVWFCTKFMLGMEHGFFFHVPENPALKVCAAMDPKDCSNRLGLINPKDHSPENYINSLKNIPANVYDKNNKDQGSWEAALTRSNE